MAEYEEKKGDMTVREAGHKGGEKTAETHGHDFYSEIGHKGGEKGGNVVKEKYGPDFYSEIGHKGGQKVKELIERAEAEEKK
ncbi:MAG: KGG domain-containing protein [Bacteroidota bacterium]